MNTKIKTNDSDAASFITQKDVILCRSGIQIYHKDELVGFITEDNKPAVEKTFYKEYRPANVVVKAKDKCISLPVTKEHPSEWVNPKNFSDLAGGVTDKDVEVVALDGESEGEIGLKANLTFYTEELYDYYKDNKEVSLGYNCRKHFVDNPDEVGYDIILDEITEVNHLAITRAGRGGSSVAIIDSIIGGLKPMRTGLFAWLASKKQKDSKPESFGSKVFEALKKSKGTTEEELAEEMKGVLDSCAMLKDCDNKTLLVDSVKDCFDHKEKALSNEEELSKTLDSLYVSISGDSLKEMADAFSALKGGSTVIVDSANKKDDEETEDSAAKEDKEDKSEDSEKKDDEDKTEDSDKEDKEKDGCSAKDSAALTKEAVEGMIKDSLTESLKPMILSAVKEVMGINDQKDDVQGMNLDSASSNIGLTRDYSDILDNF